MNNYNYFCNYSITTVNRPKMLSIMFVFSNREYSFKMAHIFCYPLRSLPQTF